MTSAAARTHWLVDVIRRAGYAGAGELQLDDAWAAVARVCDVTEDDLARQVADHYHLNAADFNAAEPRAQTLVPEKLARKYHVFPLRETDRQLVVAVSDPNDVGVEQQLGFASGRAALFEVASPAAIQEAIDKRYAPDRLLESLLDRVDAEAADEVQVLQESGPEIVASQEIEAAPVVKLTNLILSNAVREGASDIHLEPGPDGGTVRFRVDGVLRTYMQLPMPALNRVVSRIKILGSLDIADRVRPQDGRARVQIQSRTFDLRISTVPTRDAEKSVIRVLDPKDTRRLEDLGMPATELGRFRRLLGNRNGIVVVTGPTGSGKTTTLHSALRELSTGEVNIMTVEDPVEYELPGLTQIQVEPRRGVTFAAALRSILRQDPDVILVGEIRDLETADVAVQAALTGHLVLATLHTNNAVGAVARLVDVGLDRSKIAATLRGAVAQRLLRHICKSCVQRIEGPPSPDEARLAERYGVQPLVRTVGCSRCGQTGYRGRLAVLEVLVTTPTLETLIGGAAPEAELQRAALTAGLRPLREVALERVKSGETTLEEVERVLGELGGDVEPAPATEPHVLVVDDDAVNRALARALLEKNGFRVSEAADGAGALERLGASPDFRLMVLDLDMPRVSGQEVLAQVRKSVATAALPVIVLTGSTSDETEVQIMEQGADDYVRKPIDPPRFVARVKAALRRAGM